MEGWLLLLAGILGGGCLLARPDRFAFRGAALLGFLLLTLGMTSPLALHPTRMMLASGAGTDSYIGIWNLWWTSTAVAHGLNPFQTDWIFYPRGTSLALHTFSFAYNAVALPLVWLGRLGAAGATVVLFFVYNLLLIASFTLSGYFTYRVALSLTDHRPAALLAGIAFAFTNYRFANTVRLHVIDTELLVLAVWSWTALLRRPSGMGMARCLAAVLLLAYGSLEYAASFALVALVVAMPGMWMRWRRRSLGGAASSHATRVPASAASLATAAASDPDPEYRPIGGIAPNFNLISFGLVVGLVLLALPLLIQLAHRLGEGVTGFDPRQSGLFSADLLDFLLPNPRHPLWGAAFARITAGFHHGDGGFGLSVGWIPLALILASLPALWRSGRNRVWFFGFVFFALLALGPALHLAGQELPLPLPQALLSHVPLLGTSRTPIRMMAPGGLCFALALACGWAALRRKQGFAVGTRPHRIELVAGSLILFESLAAPMPLTQVPLPPVYGEVARTARAETSSGDSFEGTTAGRVGLLGASSGPAVLLHLPRIAAREDLLFQTVHRQRLASDLTTAVPLRSQRGEDLFATSEWTLMSRNFGLPGWVAAIPEPKRAELIEGLRAFLRAYRVRWIVVPRSIMTMSTVDTALSEKWILDDRSYAGFRENVRALGPSMEKEVGNCTLFEFAEWRE